MVSLADQIGIVTGASSGVGKAIAMELADRGVNLALLGRHLATLETAAEQIRTGDIQLICYQLDLSDDRGIRSLSPRIRQDFGAVDILIHSAGVIALGPTATASVEDFDKQYTINIRAPFLLTQELLPMLRRCQGQVVFINSTLGLAARAGTGQYAATKHALKAFADSLRDEVNQDGVRILSIFLGRTATPMQALVHDMEGRVYQPERLIQPSDVAVILISALTLPRSAEITDLSMRPMLKPI